MGLSYDMLKIIVQNGSNLVLESSVSEDLLCELVNAATRTGSQTTINSDASYDLLARLTAAGGHNVTVVNKR
jgi:hypothetical protein